jgi:hypothetical protein
MSEFVDEETARSFADGIFLGKTEPMRETKYMWWEVYLKGGDIIACAIDESYGICCGEKITISEISAYVEDDEEALEIYNNKLSGHYG